MRRVFLGGLLALGLGGAAWAATLPSQPVLSGGCCPGAVWTPDSRALLFLDGAPARPATASYQVPAGGGAVTRKFSTVAFYSPRVAYTRSDTAGNFDRRLTRVFVADVFGAPRQVTTLYGGGVSGWLSEGTLLLSGKAAAGNRDRDLFTLDTRTGAKKTLRTALNFRSVLPSPDGTRVVYTVAFDSAARNGLWLQSTAGGAPRELSEFGSYRWRDASRLLLIPLSANGGPHILRQYDVRTGEWRTLGDLGDQVRQGDWNVSPDGTRLSYLSAKDGNVRVLRLP